MMMSSFSSWDSVPPLAVMIITHWLGHSLAVCPRSWHLKQVISRVFKVLRYLSCSDLVLLEVSGVEFLKRESISTAFPLSLGLEALRTHFFEGLDRLVAATLHLMCCSTFMVRFRSYFRLWYDCLSTFFPIQSLRPSKNCAMRVSSDSSIPKRFL